MEIEDIINQVRFTSSEDRSAQPRSSRESTDTSIISESRSAPESISSCLDVISSDEYATHESDVSHSDASRRPKQPRVDEEVQRRAYCPPKRRRARTTSETYDPQQLQKPWPLQQPQQHISIPYGHVMQPMYYSAYMVVPVPMSMAPATHMATRPGNFSVPQRQQHRAEIPQQMFKEEKQPPKPRPNGVRLPTLPESLRRAQITSRRKPTQPKEKKERIRPPPVVHEYDHLSAEEAIQELARRNIHITDMQQVDVSKTNLVRLLQRADRNNNKGSGNPNGSERTATPT